jgi:hypothetical protein
MELVLLAKILLVSTLLSLNSKVFLSKALVAETLANDLDFIQAGFHIGVGGHKMHIFIGNIPTFHSRYRR